MSDGIVREISKFFARLLYGIGERRVFSKLQFLLACNGLRLSGVFFYTVAIFPVELPVLH